MALPPQQDHRISLADAAAMTKRHRDSAEKGSEKAHMFPRAALESLLKNPKAYGVRFYYARGDDGTRNLVVVGVDENGDDLLDGGLIDRGFPCPPYCTGVNALNP